MVKTRCTGRLISRRIDGAMYASACHFYVLAGGGLCIFIAPLMRHLPERRLSCPNGIATIKCGRGAATTTAPRSGLYPRPQKEELNYTIRLPVSVVNSRDAPVCVCQPP